MKLKTQKTKKESILKASALIVLAVFLLSIIPLAMAEETVVEKIAEKNAVEGTEVTEVTNTAENNNNDNNEIGNNNEIGAVPENLNSKMFRERAEERLQLAREQLQQTRERYIKAKENYMEAKRIHGEHRQKLLELNKKTKFCNSEVQDCTALKNELKKGVENHLLKTIDVVNRALDKLTSQIEEIEELSSDEKEKAFGKITALKDRLNAAEENIGTFSEETSKKEIKTAIDDLKQIAKDARKLQRKIAGLLINAKLSKLIEKHEEFRNGMQMRIDTLKSEGKDVSKLESLLADFDEKTETLKEDYQEAEEKWGYADSASDFDQWIDDLRESQNQVRDDLKETKLILRDFMKEYQKLKKSTVQE